MEIRIVVGSVALEADLNDSPTALKVMKILPFKGPFNTWGEEIYFPVAVDAELDETAREVVDLGDLGYWPTGKAFCIFFGRTPASTGDEIVPASAVNIIGRVRGDVTLLKQVMQEQEIRLEQSQT
jgi:hypothetical protein